MPCSLLNSKYEAIKVDKYEDRTFTHIQPHHSYFGYFNQMIEIIVNRISKAFSNLGFEPQPFQFDIEQEQLQEDKWIGRGWRCPHFIMKLEKLAGYANLCLIISPLTEQSAKTT